MAGFGGRQPAAGLGRRSCETCGSEFQPYRANVTTCSKSCYRNIPRVKASQSAIKARPASRDRRNALRRLEADPEGNKARNRRQSVRKYGLTWDDYEARLAEQGGVCHLCGKPAKPNGVRSASRLHVDHDHQTGTIRMLLCLNCNRGLGYLADDPDLMDRAAAYVRSYRS